MKVTFKSKGGRMKLRFIITLLLISVFITPITWASSFSGMYVFGDSLSDQGNFFTISSTTPPFEPTPPLEYSDGTNFGRFTNGLNYIDYLSTELGVPSTPVVTGGTNFAYGGARMTTHPYLPFGSLWDQYNQYLALGISDPGALYVVWAGANDLADFLISGGQTPGPIDSLAILISVVDGLALSGAKNILLPNIPDLGIVPMIMSGGMRNQVATDLTESFNEGLELGVSSLEALYADVNFIRFDIFSILNQIFADPESAGFTNVHDAAYSEFVEPGGAVVPNPEEYLSWDGFHPTTAAHQIIAGQMARAVVPEPATMLLFGFGLLSMAGVSRRKKTT